MILLIILLALALLLALLLFCCLMAGNDSEARKLSDQEQIEWISQWKPSHRHK